MPFFTELNPFYIFRKYSAFIYSFVILGILTNSSKLIKMTSDLSSAMLSGKDCTKIKESEITPIQDGDTPKYCSNTITPEDKDTFKRVFDEMTPRISSSLLLFNGQDSLVMLKHTSLENSGDKVEDLNQNRGEALCKQIFLSRTFTEPLSLQSFVIQPVLVKHLA